MSRDQVACPLWGHVQAPCGQADRACPGHCHPLDTSAVGRAKLDLYRPTRRCYLGYTVTKSLARSKKSPTAGTLACGVIW